MKRRYILILLLCLFAIISWSILSNEELKPGYFKLLGFK